MYLYCFNSSGNNLKNSEMKQLYHTWIWTPDMMIIARCNYFNRSATVWIKVLVNHFLCKKSLLSKFPLTPLSNIQSSNQTVKGYKFLSMYTKITAPTNFLGRIVEIWDSYSIWSCLHGTKSSVIYIVMSIAGRMYCYTFIKLGSLWESILKVYNYLIKPWVHIVIYVSRVTEKTKQRFEYIICSNF